VIGDLLTARQLQELLHVDRTTVYRMLDEGRLPGFKVGGQWRFSRRAIELWLAEQQSASAAQGVAAVDLTDDDQRPGPEVLPINCIQPIQNVVAEALEIGAVTTTLDGNPLTAFSNSCAFCDLILSTGEGLGRCRASWRALGLQPDKQPRLSRCHAGLMYARGRIEVKGSFVAMIFAGQFRTAEATIERQHLENLAGACGIPVADLAQAAKSVPAVGEAESKRILRLLQVLAGTFAEIGQERLALMNRLRRISEMSAL
jgi:excisionase family DNA binding protein